MNGITNNLWLKIAFITLYISINPAYSQWQKSDINASLTGVLSPATVADVTGDGVPDVLLTQITDLDNFTGKITLFEAPNWTPHTIDDDWGISQAIDMNGDNKIDIVAANFTSGELVWYEAPFWTRHLIASNIPGIDNIELVDIDKDEDFDILASSLGNGIVWYEAPNWIAHSIVENMDIFWFKSADIDGDDDEDVIISLDTGVYWYEAPNWNEHIINETPDSRSQLVAGDLDGDSDIDILIAEADMDQIVFYENPSWTRHKIEHLRNASGAALVDLDKDGDLDIVATGRGAEDEMGSIVWYEAPNWTKHFINNSISGASGLTVADMTKNGMPDIVVCSEFDAGSGWLAYYTSPLVSEVTESQSMAIPGTIQLYQNFPNPFNPHTTISYHLPRKCNVTLSIYNSSGQLIETLENENKTSGQYSVTWEAKNVSSGIYFYKLVAGEYISTKKMLVIK